MRSASLRLLAAAVIGFAAFGATAQDAYPSRPITMVMPYSPGGPGDTITRVFAAGKARLRDLPAVPAIAEAGVQGFEIDISFGLYAPRGTPRPVLEQLTAALQKSVADPEVRARLDAMGVSAVSGEQATPAALRAHLRNEIDTLGGLLVKAGVKAN